MMKAYFRNLTTVFPRRLLQGWHADGARGAWIMICVYVLRGVPFRVKAGSICLENLAEVSNYADNILLSELRHPEVEKILAHGGQVLELGVNIGVTARWWLSLGDQVRVAGVDMIQEAIDHTTRCIAEIQQTRRWQGICSAVGDESGTLSITFDDPLEGTNSVTASQGGITRKVRMEKLDTLCQAIGPVTLLKVDIEGAGGMALDGATEVLARTDWVVVETHGRDETQRSALALRRAGFTLDMIQGRTMWWQKHD